MANDYEDRRAVPLDIVLQYFGFQRSEKQIFFSKEEHRSIRVRDLLWFDIKKEIGGHGAIDLVMHLKECSLPVAIRVLKELEATHYRVALSHLYLDLRPSFEKFGVMRPTKTQCRALTKTISELLDKKPHLVTQAIKAV